MSWMKRKLSPEKESVTTNIVKLSRSESDGKWPSWLFLLAVHSKLILDSSMDYELITSRVNVRLVFTKVRPAYHF